jgi:hypothetical protein
MDIKAEKEKILEIYNKISNVNTYKSANLKNKLIIFIIPIFFAFFATGLLLYGIKHNNILFYASIFILFLTFFFYNISYDNYIKGKYFLQKDANKDKYYDIFIKNLEAHDIKDQKKINYYISLLELDNTTTTNNKSGFLEYISLIYIPGLMLYFDNLFKNAEIIAYLSLGILFVPAFIFIFKVLFINRKRMKYDTILCYLKRRIIELIYE